MALTEAMVRAAEDARCAVLIAGDGAAMRALFAPELSWTHGSGYTDDRERFIGQIEAGVNRYLTIDRSEERFRLYGDVALSSGVVRMRVIAGGTPREMHNLYTHVWVDAGEGPKLVSVQSTKAAQ